jgi:hypothetical protein
MYHPYFRGKQFELITIRETAELLAKKNFVPVIEPVRESLGGLKKTLSTVCDAGGRAIVIVNPYPVTIKKTRRASPASYKKTSRVITIFPLASCCVAT